MSKTDNTVISYTQFQERKREKTNALTVKEMFEKMYPGKTPEEVLDEQKDLWRQDHARRMKEFDQELGEICERIDEIEEMAIDAELKEVAESVGVKTPDLPFEDERNRRCRNEYQDLLQRFDKRLRDIKTGRVKRRPGDTI